MSAQRSHEILLILHSLLVEFKFFHCRKLRVLAVIINCQVGARHQHCSILCVIHIVVLALLSFLCVVSVSLHIRARLSRSLLGRHV